MSENLQSTILAACINDDSFVRKVLPHLRTEYFDANHGIIFDVLKAFVDKYNKLPNHRALQIELENSDAVNSGNIDGVSGALVPLGEYETGSEEWLLDSTEKWCQQRAVENAVMEAFLIVQGKKKDVGPGVIPEMLQKALAVSFDTNVGHDYIENAEHRFDFYHKKENKISFDLERLNYITKGGLVRKTLTGLLAGCVHPSTKVRVRYRKAT